MIASWIRPALIGLVIAPVASGGDVPPAPPELLIRNAALMLTMDPAVGDGVLGTLSGADVHIVGDSIAAVGPDLNAPGASIIDASRFIVMPGLIDLHTHLWQSAIRGCATNEEVGGWLFDCVSPADVLTASQAYASVRLSTMGEIVTGVTTVVDFSHSFTPAFVRGNLEALRDSGLRYAFAFDSEDLDAIMHVKHEFDHRHPLGTLQIGAFDPSREMVALAELLDVKIHIHLREAAITGDDDAINILMANGALTSRLIAAHSIHLTDEEIELLAENDVRVVHNPLSNMRLGSGVCRLQQLHSAGVKVGLGQDGGTNDTCDMFNTMRVAVGLQRAVNEHANTQPSVRSVLQMATIRAAEILDMQDEIGSLTPGKKADLIIIDPNSLNFAPEFDWVPQIVFCTQPQNVRWVFVNGVALMADGRLRDGNVAGAIAGAQQAADAIIDAQ